MSKLAISCQIRLPQVRQPSLSRTHQPPLVRVHQYQPVQPMLPTMATPTLACCRAQIVWQPVNAARLPSRLEWSMLMLLPCQPRHKITPPLPVVTRQLPMLVTPSQVVHQLRQPVQPLSRTSALTVLPCQLLLKATRLVVSQRRSISRAPKLLPVKASAQLPN